MAFKVNPDAPVRVDPAAASTSTTGLEAKQVPPSGTAPLPDISKQPLTSNIQGAATDGVTIQAPGTQTTSTEAAVPPSKERQLSRISQLIWDDFVEGDLDLSVSIPNLGPVNGSIKLRSEIVGAGDQRVREDPMWASYAQEQREKGFEVFWVTLSADIDAKIELDDYLSQGQQAKLIGEPELSVMVPVRIPHKAQLTREGTKRYFRDAFESVVNNFPHKLENAVVLPGPWQVSMSARYGIEGSVLQGKDTIEAGAQQEVRVRIRREAESSLIDGEIRTQTVPRGGISGNRLLHDEGDLKLSVSGGKDIAFYRINLDRIRIDLDAASPEDAEAAYSKIVFFRQPTAATGVMVAETEQIRTFTDGTKAGLTIGWGESFISGEVSRQEIPPLDPWIDNDQFRRQAYEERDIEYERLAWRQKRSLGISGRTSAGPVTLGGSARHVVGHYEEMVVEHPRSLLSKATSTARDLMTIPVDADDILLRHPGEQFRSLVVTTTDLDGAVGYGVAAHAGSVGFGAEVKTGTAFTGRMVRDFKRYVLPDNKILIDVRDYSLDRLALEAKAEATVRLFEEENVEELIEQYLGGTLAGPLANLVEDYFGEISVFAEHIRGLSGREHEQLLRAELDLNIPAHREVYDLLVAGEVEQAADRLEKYVLEGQPLNYVAELASHEADETVFLQRLPGGAMVEMSHSEGPGSTVREAYNSISPHNQLIASYVGEKVAEAGYPERWALGVRFGKHDFTLFSSDAFREHSSEEANYSREGPNGDVHVVTLHRESADLRIERKILLSSDTLEYHLVEFKERTTNADGVGEWSEPQVYVVADYDTDEWISGSDYDEFAGFVAAVGGNVTEAKLKEGNFLAKLFGLRHGVGDIRVRAWIPWEGLQTLGRASDDEVFKAAAVAGSIMAGDDDGLPAWADDPMAREIMRQYLDAPAHSSSPHQSNNQKERRKLARMYRELTGRKLSKDNASEQKEALDLVPDILELRDAFGMLNQQEGASQSEAADAWRDFGAAHGRDFWALGIIRWVNLLQREPEALESLRGRDDLFYLDIAELDADSKLKTAQEKATPEPEQRMNWARQRAQQGYNIVSL